MSISAPTFCLNGRNSDAEIDVFATSTSFRHLIDKSFLTGVEVEKQIQSLKLRTLLIKRHSLNLFKIPQCKPVSLP